MIILSLSYGWVVELRPRSNWTLIVIRPYKEIKLSSSTHRFGLIVVIVKAGGKPVGGLFHLSF